MMYNGGTPAYDTNKPTSINPDLCQPLTFTQDHIITQMCPLNSQQISRSAPRFFQWNRQK